MYFLDRYGWPVECVKGRWFFNFLRRLLHTRRVGRGTWTPPAWITEPTEGVSAGPHARDV